MGVWPEPPAERSFLGMIAFAAIVGLVAFYLLGSAGLLWWE